MTRRFTCNCTAHCLLSLSSSGIRDVCTVCCCWWCTAADSHQVAVPCMNLVSAARPGMPWVHVYSPAVQAAEGGDTSGLVAAADGHMHVEKVVEVGSGSFLQLLSSGCSVE